MQTVSGQSKESQILDQCVTYASEITHANGFHTEVSLAQRQQVNPWDKSFTNYPFIVPLNGGKDLEKRETTGTDHYLATLHVDLFCGLQFQANDPNMVLAYDDFIRDVERKFMAVDNMGLSTFVYNSAIIGHEPLTDFIIRPLVFAVRFDVYYLFESDNP